MHGYSFFLSIFKKDCSLVLAGLYNLLLEKSAKQPPMGKLD
jgi:hypothetical protein